MNTIPTVTKNLLIINVLMFLGTIVAQSYGIDLAQYLGLHFFLCRRFQCSTIDNIYVHARRIRAHIFSTCLLYGCSDVFLEQVWGPKRFLFYYLVCGIGAGIIQEVVQYIHYETVLSAYDSVNTGMAIIPMEEYLNMMTTVGASGSSIRHSAGIRHVVPQPANVHLPVTGSHQGQIFCYRICLD